MNRCICCGEIIPEGRQVCALCENPEIKLKPCPFCGASAKIISCEYTHWVQCGSRTCGVNPATRICTNMSDAIEIWNRREKSNG